MARLKDSTEGETLFRKKENKTWAARFTSKIPRRTWTLISITILLNALLWSSLICFGTALYQIISDPSDATSIAEEILTLTSACITISYTILHTIIFFKQRIWLHQRRDPSTIKRTTYVAIRIVVSSCVLWLLTCGWNMITIARRPRCLKEGPDLQAWEFGLRCDVIRLGMAFAMIALVASCLLFVTLATVNRPFEAHLFKRDYRIPGDLRSDPSASARSSPAQLSEKQPRGRRMSGSTRQSSRSNFSDTDIETLDLNSSRPPSIYAPIPQRSIGLGIFTSDSTPPAIPIAYATPPRVSSLEPPPPIFHPSISHQSLSRPPRLSGANLPPFAPKSIAPQYAASTWRAVHPDSISATRAASWSNPHVPNPPFAYRGRYSRSSLSLTRPRRLSTVFKADSVGTSSRSGSTGPEGQESESSSQKDGERRSSVSEKSYSTSNDNVQSGRISRQSHRSTHKRTTSAPDVTSGAQDPQQTRMAMGWKPQSATKAQPKESRNAGKVPRSKSAHALSRFSPDSSPDHIPTVPSTIQHYTIDSNGTRVMQELPFTRSRSMDPITMPDSNTGRMSVAEAAAVMISRMPQDLKSPKRRLNSQPEEKRRLQYEEVKNKPLPKIAVL